jgi:hypothetical protein
MVALAAVIARAAFTSRGQAYEPAIRSLDLIFQPVTGHRQPHAGMREKWVGELIRALAGDSSSGLARSETATTIAVAVRPDNVG